MIRELTDLLMPRECLVCRRILGAQERHLCLSCAADLPLTYYWERLHNPMANQFNALLERSRAEGETMEYVAASSLLFYHHENPYKRIPQALKYEGNRTAGRDFALRLGRYMVAYEPWSSVDTVVPVPLHAWRRFKRGYNQAEVLAHALADALDARLLTSALRRRGHARSQTSLDAKARLKNVEGSFVFSSCPTQIGHLLLVDDTFTTGATLSECYHAVRAALGPSVRISIATLAVVQD